METLTLAMTKRSSPNDIDSDDQTSPHGEAAQTPAERRISQAPKDPHARLVLTKAQAAADRLITWLRQAHPQWLLAIENASRISNPTALGDELRVTIGHFGAK